MAEEMEADVIVIGGGPVGLTLASDLTYRGISTILIEKNDTPSHLPQAVAINCRAMEHYRRLGLQERIQDAAYPRDHPFEFCIGNSAVGGKPVRRQTLWSGSPGARERVSEVTSVVPLLCSQYALVLALRERLGMSANNDKMLFGWQMSSLTQDKEGVVVKARPYPEAQEMVFKAKYLVACDGDSSWVREQLGVLRYGEFCIVLAVCITFKSPELFSQLKKQQRLGFSLIVEGKFNAVLITLNARAEFALHITLPLDTPIEVLQNLNLSQWITESVGFEFSHTVVRASTYHMHSLFSTQYRVGRCMLAGDSAHQWLPVGGLGINTGVSDAANLAWKLEAVVKGYGGPHLLDSYEKERRVLAGRTRHSALATLSSMQVRVLLVRLALAIQETLLPQFNTANNLMLGFQYSSSGVIVHERDSTGNIKLSSSSKVKDKFVPSSLPGCRAPHVSLPDCASILDLFGKKFVLLIVGGEESDLKELKSEMKERGVPFDIYVYPKLPELVACYDRKYFLVRPDGIVAWRSDCQPSTLESKRILQIVTGDAPTVPLPPQAKRFRLKPVPGIFDALVSASCTLLLREYSTLSAKGVIGIGLGVFWLLRALRTSSPPQFLQRTSPHRAIIQNKFGEANDVLQVEPRFSIFGPKDVLVRVHAASLNPLDTRIRQGYGAAVVTKLSSANRKAFFPLVLGRDCSGEVVAVGEEVTKFLPGDQVFGAASVGSQGTHAQYATLRENELAIKPSNVDHREAASLPWVAVATWTALVRHGGLTPENTRGKKILVHGGTGGVGSFAIQLLKAWGAEVATTCSTRNVNLAHHLGADKVIDYTRGDFASALHDYDVVLNTVIGYEKRSLSVLKRFGNATYVSVINPRLRLTNRFGGFLGQIAFSWLYRYKVFVSRLFYGRAFFFSTAEPSPEALEVVSKMVERGEIRPVIDSVYAMDEIVAAHKHVEQRHSRGKVIVTMD